MIDPRLLTVLSELPQFSGLPEDLRLRIASGSRWIRLQRDELLFSQDEPARGFFVVARGSVRVYRTTPDGREQVLHHLHAGSSFAEAALLSIGRYPAHCRAVEDGTEVIEVGGAVFLDSFRTDPRMAAAMVSSLSMWLLTLTQRVEELQIASAPARLALYLLRLPARGDDNDLEITLPMPKKDLAAHLAIAPETLSRLLRRWQDQGVIESRGKSIAILDSRVLVAIADRE